MISESQICCNTATFLYSSNICEISLYNRQLIVIIHEHVYIIKYTCIHNYLACIHNHVYFFLAWSSIAQSVCQQAFSLLVNRYLRPWVRILPSAEEDSLSHLDSNIACLCQSIEINNNKHLYIIILHAYIIKYICIHNHLAWVHNYLKCIHNWVYIFILH